MIPSQESSRGRAASFAARLRASSGVAHRSTESLERLRPSATSTFAHRSIALAALLGVSIIASGRSEETPIGPAKPDPKPATAAAPRSLREELDAARRRHDDASIDSVQKRLADAVEASPADYGLRLALAESYVYRADFHRLDRSIRELESETVSKYREEQATWSEAGMPHAEKALALARGKDEQAQAERVIGELYVHRISGAIAGFVNGPKALEHIRKALAYAPNDPECKRAIGMMFLYNPPINGGNVDEAIRTFRACTEKRPSEDRYQVFLAMAFRKKGKLLRAELAAKKALESNPDNSDARHLCEVIAAERAAEGSE
jgi:tetratricopeptide (TPR) repeat protein